MEKPFLILFILIAGCRAFTWGDSSPAYSDAYPEWIARFLQCERRVEQDIKQKSQVMARRWTNHTDDPKFDAIPVRNDGPFYLMYGQHLEFRDALGAWLPQWYACLFNVRTEEVVAASVMSRADIDALRADSKTNTLRIKSSAEIDALLRAKAYVPLLKAYALRTEAEVEADIQRSEYEAQRKAEAEHARIQGTPFSELPLSDWLKKLDYVLDLNERVVLAIGFPFWLLGVRFAFSISYEFLIEDGEIAAFCVFLLFCVIPFVAFTVFFWYKILSPD